MNSWLYFWPGLGVPALNIITLQLSVSAPPGSWLHAVLAAIPHAPHERSLYLNLFPFAALEQNKTRNRNHRFRNRNRNENTFRAHFEELRQEIRKRDLE